MTWSEAGRRSVEMAKQVPSAAGAAFLWGSQRSRNAIVAAFTFVFALVVEQYKGLSLVRFICIYLTGVVGTSIHERASHAASPTDLGIIVAILSAAFGEKVFVRRFARGSDDKTRSTDPAPAPEKLILHHGDE